MEILPHLTDMLGIFLVSLVVLIPIAGVTARFALRPLLDQLLRLRDDGGSHHATQLLMQRVAFLEHQVVLRDERLEQLEALVLGLPAGGEPGRISRPELPAIVNEA